MPFQVIAHDTDKFRAAARDGFRMAMGHRIKTPALGAEDFRGISLQDLARVCLDRAGQGHKTASPAQIADSIVGQARMAMGTDDFSSILVDAMHKTLQQAYRESPRTFQPFVRVVSAQDFKTIYGVNLSDAPDLDLIDEHGEYKAGTLSDKQESYSIATYGKIIYLTRRLIINDDARSLFRTPQLLGAAAARKESDLVWAKITGNPTMSEDSTSLFDSTHGNVETDAGDLGAVDSSKLSAARADMRQQTGPGGATLDLEARYLLVPVAQETAAEVLVRSRANPEVNYSSATYNPWSTLLPIAEPRLDADSTLAWYLVADPNQIDTIEVAYLGGNDEPYVEERSEFTKDGLSFKVRHDFGCGVMDYRGFFKNPGEGE